MYAKFLEAVQGCVNEYNILLHSFVYLDPAFLIGWELFCSFMFLNLLTWMSRQYLIVPLKEHLHYIFLLIIFLIMHLTPYSFMIFCIFFIFLSEKRAPKYSFKNRTSFLRMNTKIYDVSKFMLINLCFCLIEASAFHCFSFILF